MRVQIPGKKRYVTLEWPLIQRCVSIKYNYSVFCVCMEYSYSEVFFDEVQLFSVLCLYGVQLF